MLLTEKVALEWKPGTTVSAQQSLLDQSSAEWVVSIKRRTVSERLLVITDNGWGKNEGRVWHSEVCNADGTNKFTPCQTISTSDQYEYIFLDEQLGDDKAVTFSVQAHNDAHIGFFTAQSGTGDAGDFTGASHGPHYEIVLSGWGNTQSVIREAAQGDNHATTDTTGYLDVTE